MTASHPPKNISIVGAEIESDEQTSSTFEDRNITYNGSLAEYNWQALLADKQGNINS